ncbi:MAG: hypothetical protein ACAI35_14470 [Candidatus Methylacidiphilales bacterium]
MSVYTLSLLAISLYYANGKLISERIWDGLALSATHLIQIHAETGNLGIASSLVHDFAPIVHSDALLSDETGRAFLNKSWDKATRTLMEAQNTVPEAPPRSPNAIADAVNGDGW